jgi:hypothetical protein
MAVQKTQSGRRNAMDVKNSKPIRFGMHGGKPGFDNQDAFNYDPSQCSGQQYFNFSFGCGNGSQVLAVNGFANDSVNIGLLTARPADDVSIKISLGDVVNLDAWANAGATGTAAASASSQGLLTVTNGALTGTYTASLSIDVSAYIAADHATVTMQVTDTFQLSLSGCGYVGASIVPTSNAGATVTAMTPASGGAGGSNHGNFDLARFAASVLNTSQDAISFMATAPGETLHVLGQSVLTIDATAVLPGAFGPQTQHFSETEQSRLAFNTPPPFGGGHPYWMADHNPGPVGGWHPA